MARPKRHNPPARQPQSQPQNNEIAQQPEPQVMQVEAPSHQSVSFEGPIPPPNLLREYDAIVPGAAERILAMAENEGRHRHALESNAIQANINAQEKQLQINELQVTSTFKSDRLGQWLGFLISGGCVAGSIFLAIGGHTEIAAALAIIPSAAIVKAFMNK
jgi:uncharacterized membrane protein